jgi:hypothetical protein
MMTEQEATVWARERIARGRLSKPNSKKRDREMRRYRASHGGLTPMQYVCQEAVTPPGRRIEAVGWSDSKARWLWQTS